MKLYKVVFETKIMILAENENRAILDAEHYAGQEQPKYLYSEVVENESQLGEWKGCIPYSTHPEFNITERKCEEFCK